MKVSWGQSSQRHYGTQHNDTQHNVTQHNGRTLLCWVSFMLSVKNKSLMLSVILLNVIMLSVVAPSQHFIFFVTYEWAQLARVLHKIRLEQIFLLIRKKLKWCQYDIYNFIRSIGATPSNPSHGANIIKLSKAVIYELVRQSKQTH